MKSSLIGLLIFCFSSVGYGQTQTRFDGSIDACIPFLNGRVTPAGGLALELVLGFDRYADVREEAVISVVGTSDLLLQETWGQINAVREALKDRRPQVGATSFNISDQSGGVRYLSRCPVGQVHLRISLLGSKSIALPCRSFPFAFCSVNCREGACSYSQLGPSTQ